MNILNRRLVLAMRKDDLAEIDATVTQLRFEGLNYEAVRQRFNLARVENGLQSLSVAEFEELMQRLDELP